MLLPEIVSVGIFNSSKSRKNTKISKKRTTSVFEIELPIDNTGVSYINNNSCIINTNTVICSKPEQYRNTKFPYKCYFIHLIVKDQTLSSILMNVPDYIEISDRKKYISIFEKMNKYYNTSFENDEIILQSLTLELIYNLSRDAKKQNGKFSIKGGNYNVIEKSISYIKNNLTEALTLENVASYVNLSPTHFHNIFKYSVGATMREYVEEQRIKKAINLLITTNLSLTEIAYDCGFSSQSYFSFVFKRRMKTTPRKYTEKLNKLYEKEKP
ncbi:MAG: AraC family transcriptional regulator [Acutalibacteraceae bacterium]|nr:AraC family transcriptional regulator [Acutalibacteraceae bacterium]